MQRLEYIDNTKAIATLMVILLHSYGVVLFEFPNLSITNFFIANFYNSFARVCVPLFLITSGATILNKEYSIKTWVHKIVTRILAPYIFWYCIYCYINHGTFVNIFEPSKICFHFQFVSIILCCYLLYPLLKPFVTQAPKDSINYLIAIWMFQLVLMKLYPKFQIINLNFIYPYIGYFIFGHFVAQTKTGKFKISALYTYITTSIITFGLVVIQSFSTKTFNENWLEYLSPFVVIASFSIFIFIKEVNLKLQNNYIKILRDFLSIHSYALFFLHPLFLSVLYKWHNKFSLFVSGWAIFVVGTLLSISTIYFLLWITDRIPIINKFNRTFVG